MKKELTTEDKIKEVAKSMFIQKGYANTTARDIALQAGTNLALINYYFRSKEQLFKQIMMESLHHLFANVISIINDKQSSLETKLDQLSEKYIDQLIKEPDLPMFLLSEIRTHPEAFLNEFLKNMRVKETVIFKQIIQRVGKKKLEEINPIHFMINLMSMLVFPFVARPLLSHVGEMPSRDFEALMNERKQLIPGWILQMLEENNKKSWMKE